jgi:hypothetical protein
MKFKSGDRVRILQEGHAAKGQLGTVDTISFTSYYSTGVKFDEDVSNIGGFDVFNENDLELVEPLTASDNVNSPSHYIFPGGVEVIQITEHLNFCKGNAVKYLTRSGRKAIADEVEDLKKAIWYIEREIARIEAQDAEPTV